MDNIKAKIDEVVKKVKGDEKFQENFKNDPIKTVEGILGVDLPDDQIKAIVDGVKAKLTADTAKSALDSVKGLFNK